MRFGVLGPLAVWQADGRPVKVPGAKARALLADLLLHRGRVVSADRLVEDVWGDTLPANPASTLQVKISQLRAILERAEPGGRQMIVWHRPGYVLQVDADAVDADRFTALTERARTVSEPRMRSALLVDALALWRGEPFADLGDRPFLHAAVNRLEEDRLAAVEARAEARLALGEHHALVGELAELVAVHPFRERLRAAHVRALYASGRQREALDSYDELKDWLRDELGVDPGPELAELRQAILLQDPTLGPAPEPDTVAAHRARTNLPVPATDLIGRSASVTEVRKLLDAARIVTITGIGGVGKTRLALETAARLVGDVPDGVWLVELTALDRPSRAGDRTSAADVAQMVSDVLDIRDDASGGPRSGATTTGTQGRLVEALRDKHLLLVLDNCEHVVDAVAELVVTILRSTRGVCILATTQEPLRIPGEQLYAVPPLEAPTNPVTEPAALLESPAVELFVARAAAAAPGFALDHTNMAAVVSICRRLDGVPLALELAATRVRALGVDELAARLDDRFHLLAARTRGAPARQQTLRAMIDWTWELLDEPERRVLSRLAVHVDGCTLEAAEVTCAGDGVESAEVMDRLTELVNRSLVVVTSAGAPRYRLLESVTAYGVERLQEEGLLDRVRRRHHLHYADLAEQAEPHLHGRTQRQWLMRLDAEAANLRQAIEGGAGDGDAGLALRLVNALGWYWFLRGRLSEGRRLLTLALGAGGDHLPEAAARAAAWYAGFSLLAADGSEPRDEAEVALARLDDIHAPGRRARAEWFLGFALFRFGDLPASADLLDRALSRFRSIGDRWGTAAALANRSELAIFSGDLGAVARDGQKSADLFGELGDRWGQLRAMGILAELAEVTGDYERATRLQQSGLGIAEELGLWTDAAYRWSGLGRLALLTGDLILADTHHERARQLAREHSDKAAEQFAEIGLGLGARRQGKLDEAEAYLRRWLDANRSVDAQAGLPLILAELGFIAELRGDADTALRLHLDGFGVATAARDPRAVALALEGLAGTQALVDRHDHAAELLGAASSAREAVGAPLPDAERGDVDRITATARSALGDEVFEAAYHQGALAGDALIADPAGLEARLTDR